MDGGKWIFGPIYPEFRYVLDYFARLYKEGLLDPDIATATDDMMHEKNSTGKGVFTYENMTFPINWNQTFRQTDPTVTWGPLPTLKGQNVHRCYKWGGLTRGGWCIGAGCKDPQRLIELVDWQISPEGLDVTNWGIEDVHYQLNTPRVQTIEDYTTEGIGKAMPPGSRELLPEVYERYADKADPYRTFQADVGLGMQTWCILWDETLIYLWDPPGETDAWYELTANDPALHLQTMSPPFTSEEAERLKELRTDMDTTLTPAYDMVVLGQMSLSDWDRAVDRARAGAQEMEAIYNEAEARL